MDTDRQEDTYKPTIKGTLGVSLSRRDVLPDNPNPRHKAGGSSDQQASISLILYSFPVTRKVFPLPQ